MKSDIFKIEKYYSNGYKKIEEKYLNELNNLNLNNMLNKNKIKIINKDLIVNKNNKYLFKIENNKDPYNFYNLIHSINKNNKYLFKKKNNFKEKILQNISRASKYRGVSKNGNKWQVHMMVIHYLIIKKINILEVINMRYLLQ